MNTNSNNLKETKKLNQQSAAKASEAKNKYQMEAGVDYDLMEAKKLNAKSKNTSSANKDSSKSSSSN